MRHVIVLCLIVCALGLGACGGSSNKQTTPDSGVDAAQNGDAGSDGATADAGTDDAGHDAAAPLPEFGLYGNIGGKLVSIDTTTGEITEVGATDQDYLVFAWDETAQVTRVVYDVYSPINNAATPRLGTIDLCTGAITAGSFLKEGSTDVRRAEGLARNPDTGEFWISYGYNGIGAPTQYLSERIGKVAVDTAAVTNVGTIDSLQDDGDLLVFNGSTLLMLDVASTNSAGSIYSVNQSTGATTTVADSGPYLLRFAINPDTGDVFGTVGTSNFMNRGVGTVDLSTGDFDLVGDYLDANAYPGQNFTGLVMARKPVCN